MTIPPHNTTRSTVRLTLGDVLNAHCSLNECCNGEPPEITGLSREERLSMGDTVHQTEQICKAHISDQVVDSDLSIRVVEAPLGPRDLANCLKAISIALAVIDDWGFGTRLGREQNEVRATLERLSALHRPDHSA